MTRFENRKEAGKELSEKLVHYIGKPNLIVLALPRGGVPVAFEVASRLKAPLDVFIVRKLGVPGYQELAMGALATGGEYYLNKDVTQGLGISESTIESVIASEKKELDRQNKLYRGKRPFPILKDQVVIIIDDGLATGSTMLAAVRAIRKEKPSKIVVAVPVAPESSLGLLLSEVDEFVTVLSPQDFHAVGEWYLDFGQTTDEEVKERLLLQSRDPQSPQTQ